MDDRQIQVDENVKEVNPLKQGLKPNTKVLVLSNPTTGLKK